MKKPTPPKDLWEQMDAIVKDKFRDDPGFTINEFGARYNLKYSAASSRLKQLVEDGKLLEGRRKGPSGHFIIVYRPA